MFADILSRERLGTVAVTALAVLGAGYVVAKESVLAIVLSIAVLVVAGVVVAITRKPVWAAYAILFTAPLIAYRSELLGFNVSLQRILLFVGISAVLMRAPARGRMRLRFPVAALIFAGFIVFELFGVMKTGKLDAATHKLGILMVGWLILEFLANMLDSREKVIQGFKPTFPSLELW